MEGEPTTHAGLYKGQRACAVQELGISRAGVWRETFGQ